MTRTITRRVVLSCLGALSILWPVLLVRTARQDIGRMKLFDWLLDDEDLSGFNSYFGEVRAGHHHIGTTRMGFSKEDGVVDRDCRLFAIEDLYIASSSIFRTSGHANPTLMIVQLTLRLADHLTRAKNS